MALLKLTKTDEATGMLKEVYDGFMQNVGMIPEPFFYYSCSPEFFEAQMATFEYYRHQKRITPMTLGAIRYFAALDSNFPACVEFNSKILQVYGVAPDVIAKLAENPRLLNLDNREHELVAFVRRAIKDPGSVTRTDVDALTALGWTDGDIMDATVHGAMLLRSGLIMRIFDKD